MPIQKWKRGFIWLFILSFIASFLGFLTPVRADHITIPSGFDFQDADRINFDGNGWFYRVNDTLYRASIGKGGVPNCFDEIRNVTPPANASEPATATYVVMISDGSNCVDHDSADITITNAIVAFPDLPPGDEEEAEPTCESEGGELAWLACPIIVGALNAVENIADLIGSWLDVSPLAIGDSSDPVFIIWSNIRNIALLFLVAAFLIAIFGQALSLNIMDNYTVKRLIPRVGAAAIGIMLSYYICAFLIDVFNIFGKGMFNLLFGAAADNLNVQSLNIAESIGLIGSLIGVAVGAGIYFLLNLPTLGLLLLPVVLAFVSGAVVIILRQVVIISLIILSPLAFAAWILPNTSEWYKRWQKTFTVMLMMYPIIMVLLASGSIFAFTLIGGAPDDGVTPNVDEVDVWSYVAALLVLAITVGAIPFTLRFAGGILTNIAGRFNDPNRGWADRARKGLQSRDETKRNTRRQNKTAKYAEYKRQEEEGDGKNRRFRKGWLRATTGMYGYGRTKGKYGGPAYAEMVAQARTSDQRMTMAQEKAKQETDRMGDFGMNQDISKWLATGRVVEANGNVRKIETQDDLKEYLGELADAKNGNVIEQGAAFRKLVQLSAIPQIEAVFTRAASDGYSDAERGRLELLKSDNFPNIDASGAHIARGGYVGQGINREYEFNYSALPSLSGEQLASQKPHGIEGAFAEASKMISEGRSLQATATTPQDQAKAQQIIDAGQKLADGLVVTYSKAAHHQQNGSVVGTIDQIINGGATTGAGTMQTSEFDAQGHQVWRDGTGAIVPKGTPGAVKGKITHNITLSGAAADVARSSIVGVSGGPGPGAGGTPSGGAGGGPRPGPGAGGTPSGGAGGGPRPGPGAGGTPSGGAGGTASPSGDTDPGRIILPEDKDVPPQPQATQNDNSGPSKRGMGEYREEVPDENIEGFDPGPFRKNK